MPLLSNNDESPPGFKQKTPTQQQQQQQQQQLEQPPQPLSGQQQEHSPAKGGSATVGQEGRAPSPTSTATTAAATVAPTVSSSISDLDGKPPFSASILTGDAHVEYRKPGETGFVTPRGGITPMAASQQRHQHQQQPQHRELQEQQQQHQHVGHLRSPHDPHQSQSMCASSQPQHFHSSVPTEGHQPSGSGELGGLFLSSTWAPFSMTEDGEAIPASRRDVHTADSTTRPSGDSTNDAPPLPQSQQDPHHHHQQQAEAGKQSGSGCGNSNPSIVTPGSTGLSGTVEVDASAGPSSPTSTATSTLSIVGSTVGAAPSGSRTPLEHLSGEESVATNTNTALSSPTPSPAHSPQPPPPPSNPPSLAEGWNTRIEEVATSGGVDTPAQIEDMMQQMRSAGIAPNQRTWLLLLQAHERSARPGVLLAVESCISRMRLDGLPVDENCWLTLLRVVAESKRDDSPRIASDIIRRWHDENPTVLPPTIAWNLLLKACSECPNRLDAANRAEAAVAHMLHVGVHLTVVSYNTLLKTLLHAVDVLPEAPEKALAVLRTMHISGAVPNEISINSILKIFADCGRPNAPELTEAVFGHLTREDGSETPEDLPWLADLTSTSFTPSLVSWNILLHAWSRSRRADKFQIAQSILSRMIDSGVPPDVVSWNTIIQAAIETPPGAAAAAAASGSNVRTPHFGAERVAVAEALLSRMQENGVAPNERSFSLLIKACAECDLPEGASMAENALRRMISMRLQPNEVTWATLIKARAAAQTVEVASVQRCFQFLYAILEGFRGSNGASGSNGPEGTSSSAASTRSTSSPGIDDGNTTQDGDELDIGFGTQQSAAGGSSGSNGGRPGRPSGFAFTSILKAIGRCRSLSRSNKAELAETVLTFMHDSNVRMNQHIWHQLLRCMNKDTAASTCFRIFGSCPFHAVPIRATLPGGAPPGSNPGGLGGPPGHHHSHHHHGTGQHHHHHHHQQQHQHPHHHHHHHHHQSGGRPVQHQSHHHQQQAMHGYSQDRQHYQLAVPQQQQQQHHQQPGGPGSQHSSPRQRSGAHSQPYAAHAMSGINRILGNPPLDQNDVLAGLDALTMTSSHSSEFSTLDSSQQQPQQPQTAHTMGSGHNAGQGMCETNSDHSSIGSNSNTSRATSEAGGASTTGGLLLEQLSAGNSGYSQPSGGSAQQAQPSGASSMSLHQQANSPESHGASPATSPPLPYSSSSAASSQQQQNASRADVAEMAKNTLLGSQPAIVMPGGGAQSFNSQSGMQRQGPSTHHRGGTGRSGTGGGGGYYASSGMQEQPFSNQGSSSYYGAGDSAPQQRQHPRTGSSIHDAIVYGEGGESVLLHMSGSGSGHGGGRRGGGGGGGRDNYHGMQHHDHHQHGHHSQQQHQQQPHQQHGGGGGGYRHDSHRAHNHHHHHRASAPSDREYYQNGSRSHGDQDAHTGGPHMQMQPAHQQFDYVDDGQHNMSGGFGVVGDLGAYQGGYDPRASARQGKSYPGQPLQPPTQSQAQSQSQQQLPQPPSQQQQQQQHQQPQQQHQVPVAPMQSMQPYFQPQAGYAAVGGFDSPLFPVTDVGVPPDLGMQYGHHQQPSVQQQLQSQAQPQPHQLLSDPHNFGGVLGTPVVDGSTLSGSGVPTLAAADTMMGAPMSSLNPR